MRPVRVLPLAVLLLASLLLAGMPLAASQQADRIVVSVSLEGVVNQGTLLHVERAIRYAEEERAVAVLVVLDTPGGLLAATIDLIEVLLASDVPVVTYVHPTGGIATSAGTFLFLTGHVTAMAPATTIGSAEPVEFGATGSPSEAPEKVQNFASEKLRAIALHRDRPEDVAASFVENNTNLAPEAAREAGIADFIEADPAALLSAIDGTEVDLDGRLVDQATTRRVVLRTDGARIVPIDPGIRGSLYQFLGDPQVSFVLFLVGLYALIFGLASPGTLVPETIGAILLVLGLFGLYVTDVATTGLLLIGLGVLFFIAEFVTGRFGLFFTAGTVCLLLGALFLPLGEPYLPGSWYRTFRITVVVATLATSGVVGGLLWYVFRQRARPNYETILGRHGVAESDLSPEGQVQVRGEIWSAIADGHVRRGEPVEVVAREGLKLRVRRAGPGGNVRE
ncbi:MAG: NfeD family protein [Methanobacteriota archaeon]